MSTDRHLRTMGDLERTVRAIATEFKTDKVFIIGSQAILLAWPDAPEIMRGSPEIDAFPANAKVWEVSEQNPHGVEASEAINGVFGQGSMFHETHGFYIDGVDENTAKLPKDWEKRAIKLAVEVGSRIVMAVAPCPEDLIVSKLARFSPKDKEFIAAYHAERPLDPDVIEARIHLSKIDPAMSKVAISYIRALAHKNDGSGDGSGGTAAGGPP